MDVWPIHPYTTYPLRHLPGEDDDDDANYYYDDVPPHDLRHLLLRHHFPTSNVDCWWAKTMMNVERKQQPMDYDEYHVDGNYDDSDDYWRRMIWVHARGAMVCRPNRRGALHGGCSVDSFCEANWLVREIFFGNHN